MSALLPTSAATPPVLKRAREEEQVEYSKRQRQNELQTPPGYPSDFASSYAQVSPEHTSRRSSLPPDRPAHPTQADAYLSNSRAVNTGYGASESGVYAPDPTYTNPDGQCDHGVSSQPPLFSRLSYGPPYQGYRPAPMMQAVNTPGLPIPRTPRNYGPYYPTEPTAVTNLSHQQQQQTLEQQRIASPQPPPSPLDHCARILDPQQAASLLPVTGKRNHYQNNPVSSTTAAQVARKKLYAEQEQWVSNAEADLKEWTITVVPPIPLEQGTVGALESVKDNLVPRNVWRLRALSASQRYAAYRFMTDLARKMVTYDQASVDYQTLWASIINVRESLMREERAWADGFKQGMATHNRARWNQTVYEQAVETQVNQAMIVEYDRLRKSAAPTTPSIDVPIETETPLPLIPEPALAKKKKKPAKKQKSIPQSQAPVAPSVAAQVAPVITAKPDTIKHPSDKIKVPKYPSDDIKDFSTHPVTGRYKCMHEFETEKPCCKEGLTRAQMEQSILRSIMTWKSKVEVLIEKGDLHKSHMTWTKHQNVRLRKDQKAMEEKRAKEEARDGEGEEERSAKEQDEQEQQEKETTARAKAIERERQRQLWQQAPHEDNAISGPPSVPESNSPEQHDAPAPEPSPEEVAAEAALQEEIARGTSQYERDYKMCWRLESMKKRPNWPRFDEWWAARRLQVQYSQLSEEQEVVLKGPEPSGIADKDPAWVKKIKEPLPLQVQELPSGESPVEPDDSSLDDLFEDDGPEP